MNNNACFLLVGNFAKFLFKDRIVAAYEQGDTVHRVCRVREPPRCQGCQGPRPLVVNSDKCNVCNYTGSVDLGNTHAAMAGRLVSSVSTDPPEEPTLDNVREMSPAKLNLLKKAQLLELVNSFMAHIGRLDLDLKKNKVPHNVSTIDNETFKLRAELKELKEAGRLRRQQRDQRQRLW
jgi:hypothetical protein